MKFRGEMVCSAVASLLAGIASGARAQEYRIIGDGRFAEVSGLIEPDSDERFLSFLDSNPGIIGLRLNSPGGVVVSAIATAEEILRRQLSTYIGETDVCASTCSILFLAGHDRLVEGRLGIHRMDDEERTDASTIQFVLAEQLEHLFQRSCAPPALTRVIRSLPRRGTCTGSQMARLRASS